MKALIPEMQRDYMENHIKCLNRIIEQLTRIANAIEGDVLEPEEVYSEETLNDLKALNAVVTPAVVRNLDEELQATNFKPPIKKKN